MPPVSTDTFLDSGDVPLPTSPSFRRVRWHSSLLFLKIEDVVDSKIRGRGRNRGNLQGTKGNRRRKPHATVYFTHTDDEQSGNVAPAKGVLHLHKGDLKKELHINEREFNEICEMLDNEEEPDPDDSLKHQYWSMRERFERYLKREMYLGDSEERFELNFPRKKADWPGTTTSALVDPEKPILWCK